MVVQTLKVVPPASLYQEIVLWELLLQQLLLLEHAINAGQDLVWSLICHQDQ